MKRTLGSLFRRKSISERELADDYPTYSDESDYSTDRRRRTDVNEYSAEEAARGTPTRAPHHWEYESEYNYSVGSASSLNDAYKEKELTNELAKVFSHQDVERCIEKQIIKDEMFKERSRPRSNARRVSVQHGANNQTKERILNWKTTLLPVSERVQGIEDRMSKAWRQGVPSTQYKRDSTERWATMDSAGKRKVRKQMKHRRRAKDISPDLSDEDKSKCMVNISMDELNLIIKKNITSAMKCMIEKKKKPSILDESFSTETETMFSGSSTQSAEIPSGLLQNQIKAQLDKGRLRGIIKHELAKEANAQMRLSLHPCTGSMMPSPCLAQPTNDFIHSPASVPAIKTTPPTPVIEQRANHMFSPQPHDQHVANGGGTPDQYVHTPAPPPPPPPPPPFGMVKFDPQSPSMHARANVDLQAMLQQRRGSMTLGSSNVTFADDTGQNLFGHTDSIVEFNRLKNRRHTLGAYGNNDDLDKLLQFSNVIKRLDKTLKRNESSSSDSSTENKKSTKKKKKAEINGSSEDETVIQENKTDGVSKQPEPSSGCIASSLAPIQSIADQIAALSKKKKKQKNKPEDDPKNLAPGRLVMSSCAKMTLVITNLIFLIAGAALVALGVWLMMDPNVERYFTILAVDGQAASFKTVCYAILGIGAAVLIISFFGCCGVVQRSKCLLTTFLVTVCVITVIELGLAGMVIINKTSPTAMPVLSAFIEQVGENLQNTLRRSLVQGYLPETLIGRTWDLVQIELECCGATGPTDYIYSKWTNETRPETDFPDTCCKLTDKNVVAPEPTNKLLCHFGTSGFFYDIGCYDKMVGWFNSNSTYIAAAGVSILVIEIAAFISACLICRASEKKVKEMTARVKNNSTENDGTGPKT